MKKYFRIKIEIYIFTAIGKEKIIDSKIFNNTTNSIIGFLSKNKINDNNRIF
jgi:hypothetical protein